MKSNRFTDYNTVGVVQKQKKILLWKSVLNLCLVNKKQKEQQQKKPVLLFLKHMSKTACQRME